MVTEQEAIGGLSRFYRELDDTISERPSVWRPERTRDRSFGSWRMQLLATAALLLLLIGAGVLIHEARMIKPTNPVTTPNPQVNAYQGMVASDERKFSDASTPNCNTIYATSCPAAIVALNSAAQRWLGDLDRSEAPVKFVPVEAELRRHLTRLIADLNAMSVAFRANDQNGLDVARNMGASEDQVAQDEGFDMAQAKQATTATYSGSVRTQLTGLQDCALCQLVIRQRDADCTSDVQNCLLNLETTQATVDEIQGQLVRLYAPDSLAGKEARLQADLTAADEALNNMIAALNANGTVASIDLASARKLLVSALARFVSDANSISS